MFGDAELFAQEDKKSCHCFWDGQVALDVLKCRSRPKAVRGRLDNFG
jgi:hypothetical protein